MRHELISLGFIGAFCIECAIRVGTLKDLMQQDRLAILPRRMLAARREQS
jgi:hypothetical protein